MQGSARRQSSIIGYFNFKKLADHTVGSNDQSEPWAPRSEPRKETQVPTQSHPIDAPPYLVKFSQDDGLPSSDPKAVVGYKSCGNKVVGP